MMSLTMLINQQGLFEDEHDHDDHQDQDQGQDQQGPTQMGFFSFNNPPISMTTLISNNNPQLGSLKSFSSSSASSTTTTTNSSSSSALLMPCSLSTSDIALLRHNSSNNSINPTTTTTYNNNNNNNNNNNINLSSLTSKHRDHSHNNFTTADYFGGGGATTTTTTTTQLLSLQRSSATNLWSSWGDQVSECMGSKEVRSSIEDHDHHDYHHHHHQIHHLGVSAMKMKKIKGRRKVREPRFCFKTMSDVDVLDDGYKWRKYGQKVVKNTQHPRSYYRCTQDNCHVKKRVERLAEDPRMVITTYEGRHVHSPSHDLEDDSQAPSPLANFFW